MHLDERQSVITTRRATIEENYTPGDKSYRGRICKTTHLERETNWSISPTRTLAIFHNEMTSPITKDKTSTVPQKNLNATPNIL